MRRSPTVMGDAITFTRISSGPGTGMGSSPTLTPSETTKGRAASGTFKAYASGNSDGSQVAKAILQYACTVDSQGRITIPSELGNAYKTVSAFTRGTFRASDCVGLDANAMTNLAAHFVSGDLANGGVFSF